MKRFRKAFFFTVVFSIISAGAVSAQGALRLATTTSTYETGILDRIIPPFEEANSCRVHIISVGTGRAIELGKNGDVDIILVHAPEAEKDFVDRGYGVDRRGIMHNDFVIIGPGGDPAGIAGMKSARPAMRRIYEAGSTFVSRGDDSGTDKKEKELWSKAGIEPDGAWHMETGQGMSATLRIADEKGAYLLIDRATYLFNKDRIRLVICVEGDKELLNPYGVIGVNPQRHPHVNRGLSKALIDWLTSAPCRKMINEYTINEQKLFYAETDI